MILMIKKPELSLFFKYVFDEKPELSTNAWHDLNDKKQELSLIFGCFFFVDEKLEFSTNLWHDSNDKKLELSAILRYVFLLIETQNY